MQVPPLSAWNRASNRALPGCHQLGDITLRIQESESFACPLSLNLIMTCLSSQPLDTANASAWALFSTAWAGFSSQSVPVPPPLSPGVLVADDITPLLLATPNVSRIVPDIPLTLTVIRSYEEVR